MCSLREARLRRRSQNDRGTDHDKEMQNGLRRKMQPNHGKCLRRC